MKYNLFYAVVFSFCFTITCNAQLKVGNKAPEIHITDWIANVPEQKELKGKYIFLEFWATWCGPCLQALPHLHELQQEFASDSVAFVSLTYEEPAKVKRLLQLKPMSSMVVSDQSKTTLANFDNYIEGKNFKEIPMTVLIDKWGVVQWVGSPSRITRDVMTRFLRGESIKPKENSDQPILGKSVSSKFYKIALDTVVPYYFDINEVDGFAKHLTMGVPEVFYVDHGTLQDILLNIFRYHTDEVSIDKDLLNSTYDIVSKSNGFTQDSVPALESKILNYMGASKTAITKSIPVKLVAITDVSNLEVSQFEEQSVSALNHKKKVYFKHTLADLVAKLNKLFRDTIFYYDGADKNYYNFTIDQTSVTTIVQSLAHYGITLTDDTKQLPVYHFKKK